MTAQQKKQSQSAKDMAGTVTKSRRWCAQQNASKMRPFFNGSYILLMVFRLYLKKFLKLTV